ncbi:MAG: Phospholipase D1 [Caeruleum heppii]|nr:MAG: Phospholipase D1 [Caeruleum heppii]
MDSVTTSQPSDSSTSPMSKSPRTPPPHTARLEPSGIAWAHHLTEPTASGAKDPKVDCHPTSAAPVRGISETCLNNSRDSPDAPGTGEVDGETRGPPPATTLSNQTIANTTTISSPQPSLTPPKHPAIPSEEPSRLAVHLDESPDPQRLQQTPPLDASSAPGRRSVQFARQPSSTMLPEPAHSRHGSVTLDLDGDNTARERKGQTLFSKLRALADPRPFHSHGRSQSGFTVGADSLDEDPAQDNPSPTSHPKGPADGQVHDANPRGTEPNDAAEFADDADAEESEKEGVKPRPSQRQRRRYSRRPADDPLQTAPTTPKAPSDRLPRFGPILSPSSASTHRPRPQPIPRRATMTDITEDRRPGASEDEGRERLGKDGGWRRGSSWVHAGRGLASNGHRNHSQGTPEGRRPSNFRRLTGFVGGSEAVEGSPAPWRHRAERTSTLSAQKWRALKSGLRMIGQRRREENKIDHAKSAELLAELTAGTPAVLMFASMFQRDDRGHKRIPVLLEQLKIQLSHSKRVDNRPVGDRHQIFRIELEYGSGLTRMKWVIHRALRDFANLHLRYKVQASTDRYRQLYGHEDLVKPKLPRFPRTAFPYLRGTRGMEEEDDEDEAVDDETAPSGTDGLASGTDRPERRRKRPSLSRSRRSSRVAGSQYGDSAGRIDGSDLNVSTIAARKETYQERQRKKLETYLQQMIRHLMFRPDSLRLCKFLELSALGVRLAAEGSYHGKEGLMQIQAGAGIDIRRGFSPKMYRKAHAPKWFLVRHSYIVCVDSPEEMNIHDVFLADPQFGLRSKRKSLRDQKPKDIAITATNRATHPQHRLVRLKNSERKLKLLAKNERQLHQFEESIRFMAANTIWAKPHRFDSFAPVRTGVFAQWLVDGRDYMWNVSRAISMARDVVYIHDWWLSPELYMRRPAAISQKWRLDRLLQRKASEGVKVFVIVYRNINSAIPIDSSYTKFSLLDLHPNIFVQRSPNQFRQNTFFWAHHEKLCVVDHTVAFVGGLDLCFGRWDTPQHAVNDDKPTGFELSDTPKDADHCQLWPGKDYSNPRVQDFYSLDKPYEEMYDRTQVPRMPWHDISMQVVGQPARDLTRHFVQRWNYILRQRRPTRPIPILLPPPDFNAADLEALGLDGTCEVQILRSCAAWSMGTPDTTEHSIMNAYIKMIEQSDHFVYVENQFFVTSCEVEGTRIENLIGNALVERIVRASRNNEEWRAVVVIPLMPGFQNTVDSPDGTSVRLIMQCQYRSICRGESSIFGRLRALDIEPEDYIQFYSLRTWGKIGPRKMLVTEQLYIHAKVMIVDDRVAIIGSANINERSMLGGRDSECAAIVRDTDMLWSTMNGEPYLVGRFPHTLRMRLMREHLGLDVDEIMEEELRDGSEQLRNSYEEEMNQMYADETSSHASSGADRATEQKLLDSQHRIQDEILAKSEGMYSFNHDALEAESTNANLVSGKPLTTDSRVTDNAEHAQDVAGKGADRMLEGDSTGVTMGRDTAAMVGGVTGADEVLVSDVAPEGRGTLSVPTRASLTASTAQASSRSSSRDPPAPPLPPPMVRATTKEMGLPMASQLPALPATDDHDIGGPPAHPSRTPDPREQLHPLVAELRRPMVGQDCMKDPLNEAFYLDTWHTVAENNTKLFRTVFRCMPDNQVTTWKEYKEYAAYAERFAQAQGEGKSRTRRQQEHAGKSGPPGQNLVSGGEKLAGLGAIGETLDEAGKETKKLLEKSPTRQRENGGLGRVEDWATEANRAQDERRVREKQQEGRATHGAGTMEPTGVTGEVLDEKTAIRTGNGGASDLTSVPSGADEGDTDPMPRKPSASAGGLPEAAHTNTHSTSQRRRRRTGTRSSRREFHASDDIMATVEAEQVLGMTQGHLVVWPYDWLAREEQGGNWLYSIDQLAPLEI